MPPDTVEKDQADEGMTTMKQILDSGQQDFDVLRKALSQLRRLSTGPDEDFAAAIEVIADCSRDGQCFHPFTNAMLTP